MKSILVFAAILVGSVSFAQQSLGEVIGTVVVLKTNEPIYGARVFIMDQDRRYNSITQPDGRFRITAVPPGDYPLYVLKDGDTMKTQVVKVPIDGFANVGIIKYTNNVLEIPPVIAGSNRVRLISGSLPLKTLTSEEIVKSPIKFDIKSLTASMTSDVKLMDDGSLVFRGARKGDMIYVVDGMKIVGDLNLPSVAIGKMMVYSGGLPASFGDTMGGAVVIETKGYFDMLREHESRMLREEAKGNVVD